MHNPKNDSGILSHMVVGSGIYLEQGRPQFSWHWEIISQGQPQNIANSLVV